MPGAHHSQSSVTVATQGHGPFQGVPHSHTRGYRRIKHHKAHKMHILQLSELDTLGKLNSTRHGTGCRPQTRTDNPLTSEVGPPCLSHMKTWFVMAALSTSSVIVSSGACRSTSTSDGLESFNECVPKRVEQSPGSISRASCSSYLQKAFHKSANER